MKQAGSLVAPDRLRFDFTHFEGMTPEQLSEVEQIVNDRIMEDHPVTYYETSLDEARSAGVTALFGEKYGEEVRVIECGEFSKELCGGTHVSNTSEIGFLKIVSESSIGSNTRRIEAVTSYDAIRYVNERLFVLDQAATSMRVAPMQVAERAAANVAKIVDLERKAKQAAKAGSSGSALSDMVVSRSKLDAAYPVEYVILDGANMNQLKSFWDLEKASAKGALALVCASTTDSAASLLAAGNDAAVEAGFDAKRVIQGIAPLVDGKGGGKPRMAQAGGKNAAGVAQIADALPTLL